MEGVDAFTFAQLSKLSLILLARLIGKEVTFSEVLLVLLPLVLHLFRKARAKKFEI